MTATPAIQDGPPAEVLFRQAAVATWWATRDLRGARFHQRGRCGTRAAPYGPDDPGGLRMQEMCLSSGCIDLFHEVIGRVLGKLDAVDLGTIGDLAAFTARIATRELIDVQRTERTRLGFPARPTRNDGAAGRINASIMDADPIRGEWLVTLFRIMRSYPFSPRHVQGRWPVDGLVDERRSAVPSEATSAAVVRREIAQVLGVARDVAGDDWVYANLILPLNAHGPDVELADALPAPAPDAEVLILGADLRIAYQRHRLAGLAPRAAISRASLEVTGLPAPTMTPEITEALHELEPSLRRAA